MRAYRLRNLCFFPRDTLTTHLAGKYTATAIIEAYHLEAISHHSAPNWTVCLLHFHFPLSALSASLWDRPEKWHSLRLIEHPQAQTKLTEPHTGGNAWLPWLIAFTLSACEGTWQTKGGTGRGRVWLGLAWGESFYIGCQGRFALRTFVEICVGALKKTTNKII